MKWVEAPEIHQDYNVGPKISKHFCDNPKHAKNSVKVYSLV